MKRHVIFGCLLLLCGCAAPSSPNAADGISPKVRSEHCQDRGFYNVKVLKDASGAIGGYVLQPAIRDAPIPYLDRDGNILTSFHIFGSDQEKRSAMAIIGPLTKRFPVEERLDCGQAGIK
jgi:hypothetical protein